MLYIDQAIAMQLSFEQAAKLADKDMGSMFVHNKSAYIIDFNKYWNEFDIYYGDF